MRRFKKDDINVKNFCCERLGVAKDNKYLILGFNSDRNFGLSQYLKTRAWEEDLKNYRAYYLIKDSNKIVLYFSLQCGLLIKSHKKIVGGISHRENESGIEYFVDDDKIDVTKVLPAVELAHFCVNDSYRRKKATWKVQWGLDEYPVGVYSFYEYIAPKIIELASIAGLQYVYLFCADDETTSLANYYSNTLHFRVMDDMACIRPSYDRTLECMTIKIEDLIHDRNRFLDMGKVDLILEYLNRNGSISIQQAKREFSISDPIFLFQKILCADLAALGASSSAGDPIRITKIRA